MFQGRARCNRRQSWPETDGEQPAEIEVRIDADGLACSNSEYRFALA